MPMLKTEGTACQVPREMLKTKGTACWVPREMLKTEGAACLVPREMLKTEGSACQVLREMLKLRTVIPVAITAIYLSKQGVSDLGYTRAHVSFRL